MKPINAYYLIREACLRRPELKFRNPIPGEPDIFPHNPFLGFCYVASFAFQQLVPEAEVWSFGDKTHYFNKIEDKVWDLTAEQFHEIMPYNEARRVRAKKGPTKRVQLLLEEIYARS